MSSRLVSSVEVEMNERVLTRPVGRALACTGAEEDGGRGKQNLTRPAAT